MSKERIISKSEEERFDLLIEQITPFATKIEYGMGAFETPPSGEEPIQFGIFIPKEPNSPYSQSIQEYQDPTRHYVRRSELDPSVNMGQRRAELSRNGLVFLEELVTKYLEKQDGELL